MTEFIGMRALKEHEPLTTVSDGTRDYDLHNFGRLEGIEMSVLDGSAHLRWRVTHNRGSQPALVVLEMKGVSSCKMNGEVLRKREGRNTTGLDFIEYSVDRGHIGSIRFVFDNEAEVEIEAASCTLRSVDA